MKKRVFAILMTFVWFFHASDYSACCPGEGTTIDLSEGSYTIEHLASYTETR